MKKKYNYLLALAVFLVIMICFNKFGYIISYLAAIGGPLVWETMEQWWFMSS